METYIIYNANILTFDKKQNFIENGAVYIGRGTILDVGSSKEILGKHNAISQKIDAKGKLLMPGYVDMHNHLYGSFLNNMNVPSDIDSTESYMKDFWYENAKKISSDGAYYSAIKGLLDSIKNGVTTIFNMHYCSDPDHLEDVIEAYEEMSMRGVVCFEITDDGGEERSELLLKKSLEFIKKYASNDLITTMIGARNANCLSDSILRKISIQMKKTGAGFMIHLAEFENDDDISVKKFKKYPIDRLYESGVLGSKTLVVCGNYIDETDIEILSKSGASLILTPSSGMYKGLIDAPVAEIYRNKIPMSLGSDGLYSSISGEASTLHKMLRKTGDSFKFGNEELGIVLTEQTPSIANKFLGKKIGSIRLGGTADLILVDYIPDNKIERDSITSHIINGVLPARIDSTIINGKFVMQNYGLVGLDEQEIVKLFSKSLKSLG